MSKSREIVLGIIIKDGKVLVGRVRPDKQEAFGDIEYVFPGGKVDPGETPTQAVEREILEETSLEVEVNQEIDRRVHPITNYVTIYFDCQYIIGDPDFSFAPDADLDKLMWIEPAKLEKYMPSLNPKVKEYLLTKALDNHSEVSA